MGRRLGIAAVLCAALGGLVYWSNRQQKAEEDKPAKDAPPRILTVSEDAIQQFSIRRRGAEPVVVSRLGDAPQFAITAPEKLATDRDAVVAVVNNLSTLNADRVVEEKAGDPTTYGLANPSLIFEVKKRDGKTSTLNFGDETPTGGSVYLMLAGDPRVFTVPSSIKTALDKGAQDLRDKRLLTFDQDKLSRVELESKKSSVEFGKNNQNEWTILKPGPLRADGWQVEELIRKLKDAKMDAAASADDAEKAAAAFAAGTPVATAKVTDASGTQTLEVRKSKEDYYAKSSAVSGVYKVAADLGAGVDKSAADFRNKKLFDFGFSEPSKVEVKQGDKTAAYGKSGEKWFAGPKALDSTSVQNLIDKLRDLAAEKFVEGGFGAPAMEITVVSNEGKRTEKVSISKSGESYLAKRDNEPAVYQIEPKIVDGLMQAAKDVKEAQPEKKK